MWKRHPPSPRSWGNCGTNRIREGKRLAKKDQVKARHFFSMVVMRKQIPLRKDSKMRINNSNVFKVNLLNSDFSLNEVVVQRPFRVPIHGPPLALVGFGLRKEGEIDVSQISLIALSRIWKPKWWNGLFVIPLVPSSCLQPKYDFQRMFKVNMTNHGDKWTSGKTHSLQWHFPPSAGICLCVYVGGGGGSETVSLTAAEHSSSEAH